MSQDVRNAIRGLRSAPGFSAVVLVVLTLGLGAGTAVFSIVDAVVFRGLPYDQADRLVHISLRDPKTGEFGGSTTPQDFADYKAQDHLFSSIAAATPADGFTLRDGDRPEDLQVLQVTAGYFGVFRVWPRMGRPFTAEDEVDGRHRVAVISDGLWRRRFGADPDVVGRRLTFDQGQWEIIGVMPRGFRSPIGSVDQTEVWVPFVVPESQKQRGNSRSYYLQVTARLRDGISIEQANASLVGMSQALRKQFPNWFGGREIAVRSLHEALVGQVRGWMVMLFGSVGFVLLIVCINVASLQLARASARSRELQIRAALGASRWTVARGLLMESLVLSFAGTLSALVFAWWSLDLLVATLPPELPRISTVGLDLRVLGVAALAALITGVTCGLVPALQCSRSNLSSALRAGGRGATGGRQRLRSALVVAEVALAVVLLVGSGLFATSFVRLMKVDIGLDPRDVLTMDVYPRFDFADQASLTAAFGRIQAVLPSILARVRAIPGVESAGFIAGGLPLSGSWSRNDVKVPGREHLFNGRDRADVRQITSGYADAVRARLIRGREIDDTDRGGTEPVVVLNEEAARRYLGDGNPLGRQIEVYGLRTVVGIVADARLNGPESEPRPEAYVPASQANIFGGQLVVRTSGDPLALADSVRDAIWTELPESRVPSAQTLESLLRGLIAQREFNALLVGMFGLLALAIAAAGVYGVMSYLVAQRTKEIGVRMALGALPARVLGMILGRATALLAIGLAIGLVGAWQFATLVDRFLFHVHEHEIPVYVGAIAVLFASGLLAAAVPARRASRVHPVIALRE